MDEVCEGLRPCGSLMEVSALTAEGVGGDHRLGLKAVSTDWTTQFDLTQRRHGTLASLLNSLEEIFVPHTFSIKGHHRSC
jgi:hypothetical protein